METIISRNIIESFVSKLTSCLEVDVAIVGAGPSGLICAYDLAKAGRKVAVFERKVSPGGGIWGGAMLFTDLVVQEQAVSILDELEIAHSEMHDGIVTADSIEVASALIYRASHAGAKIFSGVTVEDVIFKDNRVAGVVINWSPVLDEGLQVDPLVVKARYVLDATGHDAQLTEKVAAKAGIRLETETGKVMGERPMWATEGERSTVENSSEAYAGLYVSGMAANGVYGAFRMGPIFGGMFLSGRKVARLMLDALTK